MNACAAQPWHIIGQGLAGTCLAWQFIERGAAFSISSDGRDGSSRVAAGMVNPITGKNFAPSWRIAGFLPEAEDFYQKVERLLETRFWHPLPILRLARDAKEWQRIEARMANPEATPWIIGPAPPPTGWHAAVELRGGARLDTRTFLDVSRRHFQHLGVYKETSIPPTRDPHAIHCKGATDLLESRLGPHRCAKGEILTLHAPAWPQSHIRIGAGGWLVPIGDGHFKAGSTYEWENLDCQPTEAARMRVMEIARTLGGDDAFTVTAHDAGIRPILRRSQALIGRHPQAGWVFNGLGSKGSLYAPGCARRLAAACLDGTPIDPELDIAAFLDGRI